MNMTEWNDLLDNALTRLESEPLADILSDYPAQAEALRPLLMTARSLTHLQPVVMPASEVMAANREAFMGQVEQLPAPAVSPPPPLRLKEWIVTQLTQLSGRTVAPKEAKRMNTYLLRGALTMILLVGTAGGTAVLSADSLPDSILYPVKLTVEDTRLALVSDPVDEANLNLALAETRLQEIEAMSLAGKDLDETVLIRFENHFDQALQLAAQMPEEAMAGFLLQTQDRLRIMAQDLIKTRTRVSDPQNASLEQANGLLTRLRLQVENGLQEPQLFRRQQGNMPEGTPREAGPGNNDDFEPAGNANQYGPGPGSTEPQGPNDDPGNCDNTADCEPVGEANQYGQDPANEGQNGPDEESVCDNASDCEPNNTPHPYGQGNGDQGQHGPEGNDVNNSSGGDEDSNGSQTGQNGGHNN
ncbi:MAG: hypothetical protein H6658_11955 [Ardenticatenaceae bacterium]|nr:hypothetical protein [Ardenticatenaceae bacterium]